MMELHENIDEALLLLYFSGTLGEKEKEEVENWISLSEENRKIAKQICYIHHVTDIIDTVKQIDPKQALVKLDKRLSKRKKINWWEWGIRAAAVLFIPLFLSFFYFVFNQDKNYDRYVEIRSNPGMMTKVELPDGTWVWLNSASYLKYPVSFEGEYRKDLRYIDVTWSYEKHSSTINSVELYINNTYVDNVSDYSSYQISKDAYNYATGENVLRLILNLSNGKTVEKKTKVFVNYVISMEQSVRQVGNATEVTLKYQYDKVHPVDVPSIFITDASIVSGEIKYIGTQTKTRDGSVYAETTYQINWPEAVVTYQQFDVRWSFKDIQYSKDFLAEKGKAVEQATE